LQLDGLLLINLKNDLAETYFAVGMPEKGEQLYRQWLHDEPHRGWGWIGWSDCYVRFVRDEQKDPARAEQILKQGLAVPGVEDRKYLLDRLAWLYAETGRAVEAQAVRAEIRKLDQPPVPVAAEAQGTQLRIKETFSFGAQGLPVEDVGRFAAALRGRRPRPGFGKAGTGRNDPCPCGSGKKFKRCCGRNTG
jgi:SEC-C motif